MPKQIFAKEYEEYLITGKEEALNSLASGSIEKEYFLIIRKLLKEDLSPELQKQIVNFLQRIPEDQSYRLKALNIFKKIQKNPDKKAEIIEDIKNLFGLGNVKSHSKPVKYNKTSNSCLIKVIVVDNGEETVKVSAWLNEGDAENKLVGNYFKPIVEDSTDLEKHNSFFDVFNK